MAYTQGFGNDQALQEHFGKHVLKLGEFPGCADEDAYEVLADTFLGQPPAPDVWEAVRLSNRDLIRYNPNTDEFGILRADGFIRTYFRVLLGNHRFPT